MEINAFDGFVIIVLLVSAVFAFMRGFVRETLSLAGWVGAALATLYFFDELRPHVLEVVGNNMAADIVTGIGLFLVTLVVLTLISHVIANIVAASSLSALDRTLGFVFGLARGAVLLCLAYWVMAWLIPIEDRPEWIAEARTLPLIEEGAETLLSLIPEEARQAIQDATRDGTNAANNLMDQSSRSIIDSLTDPQPSNSRLPATTYSTEQRDKMDQLIGASGPGS